MSKILIATDFSTASRNASLYGMHLANAMNAKVIFFTAYEVAPPFAALDVEVSHDAVRVQMKQKLADELNSVTGTGSLMDIEIECEAGTPDESISIIALEKKVDLIIVGIKGSGVGLKSLFGGTTSALVNSLTIPLLVVPENSLFVNPKNLLYASDIFLDVKIMAIDQMQWLTHFFGSQVSVVRIVKDDFEEVRETVNTPHKLREELRFLNTSFHFPMNQNTSEGLSEFISKHPTDMVVMLPRRHEWIERFFGISESMRMAYHTKIPILMLPHYNNKHVATSELSTIETF